MYISKKDRERIKQKFGGKCAYTGTVLKDDWQVDHIEPQFKFDNGYCQCDKNHINNLLPSQKIVNHYKRGSGIEEFRNWKLYYSSSNR
jgi:hypothetical protein